METRRISQNSIKSSSAKANLEAQKKEKRVVCFGGYLRFRKMSAAAAATMIMTAAPMATYVVVGAALVGGMTTGLGDGEAVNNGTEVGTVVGVGTGAGAGVGEVVILGVQVASTAAAPPPASKVRNFRRAIPAA